MDGRYPDLFDYRDFREYLNAYYRVRKAADARFSHRFIAKHMGNASAGWFSDVVKGRLDLNRKYIPRLAKLLGLTPQQQDYLESLVELQQAGSLETKTRALTKLVGLRGVKPEVVDAARFEYYSQWYYPAIRELLTIVPPGTDYDAVAKCLRPSVTLTEAKKAVTLLLKLGLVTGSVEGRFLPGSALHLTKDSSFKSMHWTAIMKAFMELALNGLDGFTPEERDYSAITLTFSDEGMAKARLEILAMRRKLAALSENDTGRDKVYQCNVQLFPLSRSIRSGKTPKKATKRDEAKN